LLGVIANGVFTTIRFCTETRVSRARLSVSDVVHFIVQRPFMAAAAAATVVLPLVKSLSLSSVPSPLREFLATFFLWRTWNLCLLSSKKLSGELAGSVSALPVTLANVVKFEAPK